mgnify:FL=1
MLEWVENERMHGRTRTPILTNQCSYESDNYSPPPPLPRNCREHTAYSPPRTEAKQRRTPVSERRVGTGRMLPKPPPGGSHLVLNAAQATITNIYSLFIRKSGNSTILKRSTSVGYHSIKSHLFRKHYPGNHYKYSLNIFNFIH